MQCHVVAIDMSPAQNAVLEVKLAAIKMLSYEDYLLLLGEREDPQKQRFCYIVSHNNAHQLYLSKHLGV